VIFFTVFFFRSF